MAYRSRIVETVQYGKLPEYLAAIKELKGLAEKAGRVTPRVMTPVAGPCNQVILEFEFSDLAAFDDQIGNFWSDPEALRVWRSKAAATVQGASYSELLSDEDL